MNNKADGLLRTIDNTKFVKYDAPKDYTELKKLFVSPSQKDGYAPYVFVPMQKFDEIGSEEMAKLIMAHKKSGFSGIIPIETSDAEKESISSDLYLERAAQFEEIIGLAEKNSLNVIYCDEAHYMKSYLASLGDDASKAVCKVIKKMEYECMKGDKIHRKLYSKGITMSVTAVDIDRLDIIDLRDNVVDGYVDWQVPDGNFTIHQYVCEESDELTYINLLDYSVAQKYISSQIKHMCENIAPYVGTVLNGIMYRDIAFAGENRRMWDDDFNNVFREMYGFDPAPYYPAMFMDIGKDTLHYKALFMSCRVKMMADGYLKAISDFAGAHGLDVVGFAKESKATACPWIFGDAVMIHKYATIPGADMSHAYMYGLNGIKPAVSAATAFNREMVAFDEFRNFKPFSNDLMYRETMSAFTRGGNLPFVHLGADSSRITDDLKNDSSIIDKLLPKRDTLEEYTEFCARVSSMLGGGRFVCDTAVLYPIHSLYSHVYLYESPESGLEYPSTPYSADYMTLLNSLLGYVGIDAAFIHPDVMTERCYTEDGVLCLNNENTSAQYRLIIIPGMELISLKCLRMLKKYYDDGGKIIATVKLPTAALEFNPETNLNNDDEVKKIITHIFGFDIDDKTVVRNYYQNTNEKGGVAYFFHSSKTAADGTDIVSGSVLAEALKSLKLPIDIELIDRPRIEYTGILNYNYSIYEKIGLDKRIDSFGTIGYVHKKYAGCDIYYITNTGTRDYKKHTLLRGHLIPEEWNPHNGKIRRLSYTYVRHYGEVYTYVEIEVPGGESIFIVSNSVKDVKEIAREQNEDLSIPEYEAYIRAKKISAMPKKTSDSTLKSDSDRNSTK